MDCAEGNWPVGDWPTMNKECRLHCLFAFVLALHDLPVETVHYAFYVLNAFRWNGKLVCFAEWLLPWLLMHSSYLSWENKRSSCLCSEAVLLSVSSHMSGIGTAVNCVSCAVKLFVVQTLEKLQIILFCFSQFENLKKLHCFIRILH